MVKLSELLTSSIDLKEYGCTAKMERCPYTYIGDVICSNCMWKSDNVPNTKRVIKIIETLEL